MKALPKRWIEYLREQPESGMGYQNVDIQMKDGKIIPEVAIFNGSVISDLHQEWRDIDPLLITAMTFKSKEGLDKDGES